MTAFHALHAPGARPLLLPNAWDYASAAALCAAGFAAIGTTSLGVAAAHGLPDGEGRTHTETLALTRRLAGLPCLLTVDAEAGFGDDPDEVAGLAAELAAAGAAGINLEDGRSDGTLSPVGRQRELIAAVKARVPDLFVNARSDTHWLTAGRPPALSETLGRAEAYLEAGADGIFVPALTEPADIRRLVAAFDAPLNVLYSPGHGTVRQLADLGVGRISCGSLLFRAALAATVRTMRAVAAGEPIGADPPSYAETQQLIANGGAASSNEGHE